MDSLLIGLAAILSFVFGWNNSSLLIGNVRGSGTLSRGTIVTLAVVGLFLGSVLEGPKMVGSLTSLAPSASFAALAATIVVSLVLTAAMTMLDLPVSFSMVMVGAFMGATRYLRKSATSWRMDGHVNGTGLPVVNAFRATDSWL